MKVNLTKLLEIPERVIYINNKGTTGEIVLSKFSGTSSDRVYSFELEEIGEVNE